MDRKLVQPIKWHGGKHYLAPWIISHMPRHLHFVEPYFGGGSVLLARDLTRDWMATDGEKLPSYLRGCSEVVNDIHGELTNFWRVLQSPDDFQDFRRRVDAIPFSSVEWEEATSQGDDPDQIQMAVNFFVRARQSRQGLMTVFATLTRNRTRRRMNEQASSYWTAVEGLADVHKRLQQVVILNQDAIQVIHQQDGQHTLFYCDPPYLHNTRATTADYEHEMCQAEHEALLKTLSNTQGKFLLSGYRSELYDDYAATCGWRLEEREIDNKASSRKSKEKKVECLWMNF
ncbi:MAG: DNA adenine methylase [Pirellulaceae bacterium]